MCEGGGQKKKLVLVVLRSAGDKGSKLIKSSRPLILVEENPAATNQLV
jgi:hypothetical protein